MLLAMCLAPTFVSLVFTVPDLSASVITPRQPDRCGYLRYLYLFTYVAGQMRGVGIVFRYLEVDINLGVPDEWPLFFYAVLCGMKGITYTQVAQYCVVMIVAYMIPAILSPSWLLVTRSPTWFFGGEIVGPIPLLDKLNQLSVELGFAEYTSGTKSTIDMFFHYTGTDGWDGGLPHVIVRFSRCLK